MATKHNGGETAVPPRAGVSAEDFQAFVVRSGLLSREQLLDALRAVPLALRDKPVDLANHLIRAGKLTQFQAQKLLHGVTGGLVFGPYHIQTLLGRGGMGSVYLARDTRTGQHVALKILPPKMAREHERYLARFEREKGLSQRVQHPHIARTLEVGETNAIHYIAMEYIPGQTLYRLVLREGPLPVPRAARLFGEVASALDQAHGVGLIHRDLKPSNLMVTPHDHAKILDLGLAYMVGEQVEDVEVVGGRGYVVGSVDYMPPEQTRDASQVDPRSDVYALGCCLYFALTGKPVYPAGTMKEKIHAQRHLGPEPVRNRNPQVPDGFAALVHKMLAKDPNRRYQSAAEVGDELRRWAGQGGTEPVEREGDAVYREAIRNAVTTVPAEAGSSDDAVLFRIQPVSDRVVEIRPAEPEAGFVRENLWWLLLAAAGVLLLGMCVLGCGILAYLLF